MKIIVQADKGDGYLLPIVDASRTCLPEGLTYSFVDVYNKELRKADRKQTVKLKKRIIDGEEWTTKEVILDELKEPVGWRNEGKGHDTVEMFGSLYFVRWVPERNLIIEVNDVELLIKFLELNSASVVSSASGYEGFDYIVGIDE